MSSTERKLDGPYDALKLENQLCFPLYACARRIVSAYTPYLKPLGLTYTQYICMMVLWEEKELGMGELCKRLSLDSGTLTPLLKKLETAGYVRRARCPEDERTIRISLTDEGAALRDQAVDVPKQMGACVPLTAEEAAQLYTLLYKLLGTAPE